MSATRVTETATTIGRTLTESDVTKTFVVDTNKVVVLPSYIGGECSQYSMSFTTDPEVVSTPVETVLPTGITSVPVQRVLEAGSPTLNERTVSTVSE